MAETNTGATAEAVGQLDESEELAKKIGEQMRRAKSDSADWRTLSRKCYDFAAGNQWSEEDQAILNEQRRPPVTFNRISRTLNAVIGLEVANRQEVRFIPRGNEDTGFNEMLTDAARWVRDQTDVEDEETESFGDLNICGMGWTETALDYDDDPDGLVTVTRCDPLEMFWDSSATRKNLQDSRWIARVSRMSSAEIKENWPEYEAGGKGVEWLDSEDEPHDASPPFYDNEEKPQGRTKDIEVVHYQWYERESYYRVKSGAGMVEFAPDRFNRIKDRLEESGLTWVEQKRRVYYYAYLIGDTVYEDGELAVQEGGFTLKAMTGMRDRNANSWFGLVAIMMDPQMWANKWLSQTMHIMNSNAKGGLMAETGAFADPKKAKRDWAKPDALIEMNPSGLEKVRERNAALFPQGVHELMKYAVDAISDTPGINQELMGLTGKEQPGVLESMRKQAGVTMLTVMFDSLRLYRKQQGRILAAFIRDYISDGRLIRVVGPEGQKYLPLMHDQVAMRYDTVIDEAPTSHNQKEKVMQILLHLAPVLMESGMPPPPPEVLEYLPVPESLMEKWLQKARPNPEQQQKQAQEKDQERQVLLAERQSKAELQKAQAMKAQAEAQKAMHDIQQPPAAQLPPGAEVQADMQMTREKAQIEAATDIEVARIRAVTAAEIERMKLAGSVPDENMLNNLQQIISNTDSQMQSINAALMSVTSAVAESQAAVAELQQPKTRTVKVLRDSNGDITGADILDERPGSSVSTTRAPGGDTTH